MSLSSLPTLNLFDGFLLVLTGVSILTAFRHGLVRVVFSLSGLIFGVLAATWVHTQVNAWIQPYVTVQVSGQLVSFLAVVMVVYTIFALAGEYAGRVATGAGTSFYDRLLGAGIGLLRASLVGAVALMTLTLAMPHSQLVEQSVFAPYLVAGTHAVAFAMPEEFREQVGPEPAQAIPVVANALEARTMSK